MASLARGAADLFRRTQRALASPRSRYLGLDLAELLRLVEALAEAPGRYGEVSNSPVVPILPLVLRPNG